MSEQAIRRALAGKLKEFRKRKGLTTAEVGAAVDKSPKTVSGWENGRGQPDADMLFRLCELYGVNSIAEFYIDAADGTGGQLTEDEEALLSAFRGLNREARELMLKIAGGFAGNPCMTAEEK